MIVGIRIGHDAMIAHEKNIKVEENIDIIISRVMIEVSLNIEINITTFHDNNIHQ